MNAELQERKREFEAAKAAILDLVAGLSEESFNKRPDDGRWSIAECIDHLVTAGRQVLPRLEAAVSVAWARGWTAEPPFLYGRLGNWFVRVIGDARLPPGTRLKAPRLYRPQASPERQIRRTVEEFVALQHDFIKLVERAEGLDLARIKIASPVTRLLRLSLGQWLDGMSGHQRRHLWQAAQVKQDLRN